MPVARNAWVSDGLASFSVAMVALPVAMGGGLIAMAPLGPAYVSLAVKSGLICECISYQWGPIQFDVDRPRLRVGQHGRCGR